jgi:hypothetical protein
MGPHPRTAPHITGWQTWQNNHLSGRTWSARPIGALSAVVVRNTEASLVAEVHEYMRHLDQHVYKARKKLDALPHSYIGERAVQEALIDALAKLSTIYKENP